MCFELEKKFQYISSAIALCSSEKRCECRNFILLNQLAKQTQISLEKASNVKETEPTKKIPKLTLTGFGEQNLIPQFFIFLPSSIVMLQKAPLIWLLFQKNISLLQAYIISDLVYNAPL